MKNNDPIHLDPAIRDAFDPEHFRETGHRLVDLLADYLEQAQSGKMQAVLPNINPEEMLEEWKGEFPEKPSEEFLPLIQKILDQSNHLHHPGYVGHQVSAPLPLAALCEIVGKLTNNASAIYEMGPVNIAMERRLVQWMCGLIGYGKGCDGIMTSGGTIGNLTALLAARQAKTNYDIWSEGVRDKPRLAVLISEQTHYSVRRAVAIMGLGQDAVVTIPVNDAFRMEKETLQSIFTKTEQEDRKVIAVVGNGCSTATGTYDDLNMLADFAESKNLWFHVDGAHGASALLSAKYKHLLRGIHRADSVVWDAHKMLLMPALITSVLFKEGLHSYEAFSQKASYLFEKEARDEWYNFAHRTVECTKTMMGFRLYVCLQIYGTDMFQKYIDYSYGLTKSFASVIQESSDFELGIEPESNIICFRYTPPNTADINGLQKKIRQKTLEDQSYYIVQTELKGNHFLRCTLINPFTSLEDCKGLLEKIRQIGKSISGIT